MKILAIIAFGLLVFVGYMSVNYDLVPHETTVEKVEKDYYAGYEYGLEVGREEKEEAEEQDAYQCILNFSELGYKNLFVCPDKSQEIESLKEALRISDSAYSYGCNK